MKTDEAMILSQIMQDQSFFHELVIDEDCFLREDTRRIYRAIAGCIAKGKPVDLIAVSDDDAELRRQPEMRAFLAELPGLAASPSNWRYYEDKVKRAYQRKRLHDMAVRVADMSKSAEVDETIRLVETTLMSLALDNSRERIVRLDELGPAYVKELQDRYENKGQLRGLSSGFESLDALTHGFQPRRLYYIGARPSQGKSALMVNMASHIGLTLGEPVGIISIESSGKEIIERIFASVGNIPGDMLATGFWGPSQMHDIGEMAARIRGKPFFIYDKPNLKLGQVKSVARVMRNIFNAKIIFVDYLQLIRNENARMEKTAVVMESSQALKELARELEIPIVALAQLGRDADDKRPGLGAFQWASQVEQDADSAILIWHEQEDENVRTKLLVEKNRDGKKKDLDFRFDGEYYRFSELDKSEFMD
ncbi:MAG: hypothetical protein C0436_00230 [Alphaproteobacteria bacterium]|nr:hypothetical protein [Alphaproteobacteria bacterium]